MSEEIKPESVDIVLGGKVRHLRICARELALIDRTFRGQQPPVNPLQLIDDLVVVNELTTEQLERIGRQVAEEFPAPAGDASAEDIAAYTRHRDDRRVELLAAATTWQLGSMWALQVLLWATLRREEKDLTLDGAVDLIDTYDGGNLAGLAMLVQMAWSVGGLGSAMTKPKNAQAETQATQH